jgi:CRISPR-associated protein Csb2
MSPESCALLIRVRLHDGRYHGAGGWPPSPARLFQALVAGAGLSGPLGEDVSEALRWLERRAPPLIGAPVTRPGQGVMFYMPNNDLDAVGGDPRRTAEIRTATKFFTPLLFDAAIPFLYAWPLNAAEEHEPYSKAICALSECLYQLGRGVDMAWAWGAVLDAGELETLLSNYPGRIYRPSSGGHGDTLTCPQPDSLQSLVTRYQANTRRFKTEAKGKKVQQYFSQAPRPRFRTVTYESPPSRRVYELRERSSEASFAAWPLARASKLVVCLRAGAVGRLRQALPSRIGEVERVLVGRKSGGADEGPTTARARIVPLPSIGHHHADRAIRRVLVEVPGGCPLRADDVHWAFSGLELVDAKTGEDLGTILTPASDDSMLERHYGGGGRSRSRTWRSVTAVALPETAGRRRIEPTHRIEEAKDGRERASELARAAAAVTQALRHAEVRERAEVIRVQREPFEGNGERVEAFAPGTRFARDRLWHVEITFERPLSGPLVIGDGRFLGLGLMAPVQTDVPGVHAFCVVGGLAEPARASDVTRALRRAVMARVQVVLGHLAELAAFFTGHGDDARPARSEQDPHLAFAFDPASKRLLVIAPHVLGRRTPGGAEIEHLRTLDAALDGFRVLLAGAAGALELLPVPIDAESDAIFGRSRLWVSVTPYVVTRHAKAAHAWEALAIDIRAECRRIGLPEPQVEVDDARGAAGLGLVGSVRLTFQQAVAGPIVLGRNRHSGGGVFQCIRR